MADERGADSSRAAVSDGKSISSPALTPPNDPLFTSEFNDYSDEPDDMAILTNSLDGVDESLIEVSISQVASRMKSPNTPAIEKAAAMEDLEGGGYFDVDSDPETPVVHSETVLEEEYPFEPPTNSNGLQLPHENEKPHQLVNGKEGLALEGQQSSKLDAPTPSAPWNAGPRPPRMQRDEHSLTGVFSSARSRSQSGGSDGLKKFLPKSLSSMSQMSNIFGSSSSPPSPKSADDAKDSRHARATTMFNSPTSPVRGLVSGRPASVIVTGPRTAEKKDSGGTPQRPKVLRRVTSDDSLLYHSLSRASSLGDDTRFENHREQVNSRAKAIKDSLQDRSSFRMPQLPSLPSMPTMPSMPSMPRVPSFSFNINFLTATAVPTRKRIENNVKPDVISGNPKKRPLGHPSTVVAPGIIAAAISLPKAAIEPIKVVNGVASSPLDRAMASLTGDIVILGGYRGSVLRSTKTGRQVWVPVKVGLNLRKVDLEVGLEPEDEERMEETIYPSGMLQNIGPVDISKRLFKRLKECENAKNGKLRVWDYGYDWRLSPHLLSRKLTAFLEGLPSNRTPADGTAKSPRGAMVIAHSLGGVITRHVVNHRPELFSGVVYAGVPQSCVNILGPLRNGDAVLLSQRVLTAQVNFTLRTSFVLLPEDSGCFIDINTKEKYPVDFFNLDDWIKYRLSPCTDPPLPPRNQPTGRLDGLINMSSSLLSLPVPGRKSPSGQSGPVAGYFNSQGDEPSASQTSSSTKTTQVADALRGNNGTDRTLAPSMGNKSNPVNKGQNINTSVSTAVTIPRDKAIAYLARTLKETKKFKEELYFNPVLSSSNRYPPLALIYGKSIPTCCGAKVDGRDGIPCSDVYDNLAFASGDGVCLAKEAMLPVGYKAVNGGRIRSDRGHVTLLGDLNAVGRALEAVLKGRSKGIGLGVENGEVEA